ncbi:MAG: hypothetical protein LBQ15_06035 [Clostridium sp.]|nr:hypothetical protein [Clostridium sp.]
MKTLSLRKISIGISTLLCALALGLTNGQFAFAAESEAPISAPDSELAYFGENTSIKNSLIGLTDILRTMKRDGASESEVNAYYEQYMNQQRRLRYDLDGYINDQLNSQEQDLYDEDPVNALLCMANGVFALEYAEDYYSASVLHNGNGDAFRHVLWNYGMYIDVGYNFAKSWSDAHEYGSNGPALERQMDLYNNAVGLELGEDNPSTILHSTFKNKSRQKVRDGECKIFSSSGTSLTWSNSAGEL